MPVRIVSDESLPLEYFDVSMNNLNCYFSSVEGNIYEEDAASENNGNIDLIFYVEEQEGGFVYVFFAPILLNSEEFMGEGNIFGWGIVPTEFRSVEVSSDDFDGMNDFNLFQDIFDAGTPVKYVYDAPAGSHCTSLDGTIQEGAVIGFKGAYDCIGFIRINNLNPDGVIFDVKVQPS